MGRLRVWLRDPGGERIVWVSGWTYCSYTLTLNDVGRYELHLPADHHTVEDDLFELDGEVQIQYQPEGGAYWNRGIAGLIRYKRDFYEGGDHRYVSIGRSPEHLLSRRLIIPPDGEAYDVRGTDYADVVIRGYVNDHAGPGAGSRAIDGLYVDAAANQGRRIREEARYYNLLETIKRLAASGLVDFDIVPVYSSSWDTWEDIRDTAQEHYVRDREGWLFRVHFPHLGLDRRRGNDDGNPVQVFSLTRGNMENPSYTLDQIDIRNHCYVLGQGVGEERTLVEVIDTSAFDSPYNDIEYQRDARHAFLETTLETIGRSENALQAAREEFSFTALETAGSLYGVHWGLGDWATAEYIGKVFDVRCVEVTVTAQVDRGVAVESSWRSDVVDLT